MEFLAGLLFLASLVALVAFVLFRAATHDQRDARVVSAWASWALRRHLSFVRGGRKRGILCTMKGRIESIPFVLEVRKADDGASLVARAYAAASEPRRVAFVAASPTGTAVRVPEGFTKGAVGDAAFGHAFDLYTAETGAPPAPLDVHLRSALLRFPMKMMGGALRFAYEHTGASVEWPVEDGPNDAEVDAALAVLLVACPITMAAKKKMN